MAKARGSSADAPTTVDAGRRALCHIGFSRDTVTFLADTVLLGWPLLPIANGRARVETLEDLRKGGLASATAGFLNDQFVVEIAVDVIDGAGLEPSETVVRLTIATSRL